MLVAFALFGDTNHAVALLRRPLYGLTLAALVVFFLPVSYSAAGRIYENDDPSSGCFTSGWRGTAPLVFGLVERVRNKLEPGPALYYDAGYGITCS
jgi:hypothetical protein